MEHDYLSKRPFDLYAFHMFHQVAKHGSFTRAAQEAGLSQSAVTRQIQSMERLLGTPLLERTTRKVRMTPAGEFLYGESQRMVGDVAATLRRLREEYIGSCEEVKVGLSRQITHALLPGLFHRQSKPDREKFISITRGSESELLGAVESHDLDLAIMDAVTRLPRTLAATHQFEEPFTVVFPAESHLPAAISMNRRQFQKWSLDQRWILPPSDSVIGSKLAAWLNRGTASIKPAMEIDDLDMIIHTVAMGLGVAVVPIRSMATFRRKQTLGRINLKDRFSRALIVVVRKHRKLPAYLGDFIANLLF